MCCAVDPWCMKLRAALYICAEYLSPLSLPPLPLPRTPWWDETEAGTGRGSLSLLFTDLTTKTCAHHTDTCAQSQVHTHLVVEHGPFEYWKTKKV